MAGTEAPPEASDFPTVRDGLRGMQFVEAVVRSSQSEKKWVFLYFG